MATLADLWEAEAPAKSTKVPDSEQSKRDNEATEDGHLRASKQRKTVEAEGAATSENAAAKQPRV